MKFGWTAAAALVRAQDPGCSGTIDRGCDVCAGGFAVQYLSRADLRYRAMVYRDRARGADVQEWVRAAQEEPWTNKNYEVG